MAGWFSLCTVPVYFHWPNHKNGAHHITIAASQLLYLLQAGTLFLLPVQITLIYLSDFLLSLKWEYAKYQSGVQMHNVLEIFELLIYSGFEAVLSRRCWIFPIICSVLEMWPNFRCRLFPAITVMIGAGFTLSLVIMMWCQVEGGLGKWREFFIESTHISSIPSYGHASVMHDIVRYRLL